MTVRHVGASGAADLDERAGLYIEFRNPKLALALFALPFFYLICLIDSVEFFC